jgi:hypothetical protein
VVVTALDLANELNARFDNSVSGGTGVAVTTTQVELPGGDPNDLTDNVTQFSVNVGLPLNSDTVTLAALKLGSTAGQAVESVTTAVNVSTPSDVKLATEKAIANAFVNLSTAQTISGKKTFTTDVDISGELRVTGDIYAFTTLSPSDRDLKLSIRPIQDSLDKLSTLSGNHFEWDKERSGREGADVGVIAQEVQSVLPEAVNLASNGYLAVSYEKIIPLLIEAIKELKKQVDQLRK